MKQVAPTEVHAELHPVDASDGVVLSAKEIAGLASYTYKAAGSTTLDRLLNNAIWVPVAERLPKRIAPNAITLTGLACIAVATAITWWHSPSLAGKAPSWCYALNAAALFVYQILDAVDGKQARRTNSSSPLGQLFDHGCDAVSNVLLSLTLADATGLGFSRATAVLLAAQIIPFFVGQWNEHATGRMRTGVGELGVSELQLTGIVIFAAAAIFRPEAMFGAKLPAAAPPTGVPELDNAITAVIAGARHVLTVTVAPAAAQLQLRHVVVGVAVLGAIYLCVAMGAEVIQGGHWHALLDLAPVIAPAAAAILALPSSPSQVPPGFDPALVMVILACGFAGAHACNRMIIATLSRVTPPSPVFGMTFAGSYVLLVAALCIPAIPKTAPLVDTAPLFQTLTTTVPQLAQLSMVGADVWCFIAGMTITNWAIFAIAACSDLAAHLGIPILTMPAHAKLD